MGRRTTRWARDGKPSAPAGVVEPDAAEAEDDTSDDLAEQDDHTEEPDAAEAEEATPEPIRDPGEVCTVVVCGPGSVLDGSGMHGPGEHLRMTRADALSMRGAVRIVE